MDTSLEMQPPLTGIRVIDFGHYIAGLKSDHSKLKQIPGIVRLSCFGRIE